MKQLYSLWDKKSAAYMSIMEFVNDEVAKRDLRGMFMKEDNMLSIFPEDYDLYNIGAYDEKTGVIIPANNYICNMTDIRREVMRHNAVRKQSERTEESAE